MAFQEGKVQEQQEQGHHITRAHMVLSTVVIAQLHGNQRTSVSVNPAAACTLVCLPELSLS